MDARGNILSPEELEKLTRSERGARSFIPIPHEQLDAVRKMSVADRVKWHKKERTKAQRKARRKRSE